jgi:hypothetical protein
MSNHIFIGATKGPPQETKAREFFLRMKWVKDAAQEIDYSSSIQFGTNKQAHTIKMSS